MKDLLGVLGVSRSACLRSTSPVFFPSGRRSRKALPHSAAPPSLPSPTHHPSAYLHPPTHTPPFLLTLAKPLCMLIGGGLIQFAAVVDQWWITFPSFGHAPLAQGGGRTWRRKQQWSRAAAHRQTMWASVPPPPPAPLFPFCRRTTIMFSQMGLFCAVDGSGLWHWASETRTDIVSAGAGGGRIKGGGVLLEDSYLSRSR